MLNPLSPERKGNITNYPSCGTDSMPAQGLDHRLHIQPGTGNGSRPPSVQMGSAERIQKILDPMEATSGSP